MKSSGSWKLWFGLMLVVSMLAFSSVAEAGRRKRCSTCAPRSCVTSAVCQSASVTGSEITSVPSLAAQYENVVAQKSKVSTRMECQNGQCRLVSASTVKTRSVEETHTGWQAEAERQASLMAQLNTYRHVASAEETCKNAGFKKSNISVGVGMDGEICSGSGELVADATAVANGHSYHCRIWLR